MTSVSSSSAFASRGPLLIPCRCECLVQIYNSPAGISPELLSEIKSGMWRVSANFERHLKTFLTLLPVQSHLDLRFFLARSDCGASQLH